MQLKAEPRPRNCLWGNVAKLNGDPKWTPNKDASAAESDASVCGPQFHQETPTFPPKSIRLSSRALTFSIHDLFAKCRIRHGESVLSLCLLHIAIKRQLLACLSSQEVKLLATCYCSLSSEHCHGTAPSTGGLHSHVRMWKFNQPLLRFLWL